MPTKDELQTLLQKRLDVLQVELSAAMQSQTDTVEAKLNAMVIVNMLAGARTELLMIARCLGLPVDSQVEVTRSEVDIALYPSSEVYEGYLRHMKGTCGCAQRHHQTRKVS